MLKKILKTLGIIVLLALVAFLVIQLWYLPGFCQARQELNFPRKTATR